MTTCSPVAFKGGMRLMRGIPKVEETEELYGNSVSKSNGLSDEDDNDDDDDDDCILLETNPYDERTNFINLSRRLSWDSAVCHDVQNVKTNKCDIKNGNDNSGDDTEDDCIILERNPFEKVIDIVSPLLKHKLESEHCRHLSLTMKSHEYVFIDDDCSDDKNHVVVETTMLENEILNIIANLPKKVSLDSGTHSQNWDEEDEISVIAERGQVACRDYPHSRHLCAQHPFNNTPHETYCPQCYCYVCDIKAPCKYWEIKLEGHCHASEFDNKWKDLRDAGRQTTGK